MPPLPSPLTFRSISRTHLSTRWLVQTTGSVFCVSHRALRSWRAWELENRESVEDMRDTRRSRVEGSSMVLVGSSVCLCDEGHPQLPEVHRLCCEKQKNLPPRVQGIGCVGGGMEREVTLHVLCVSGLWHLCPREGSRCSGDICGDPVCDRDALEI